MEIRPLAAQPTQDRSPLVSLAATVLLAAALAGCGMQGGSYAGTRATVLRVVDENTVEIRTILSQANETITVRVNSQTDFGATKARSVRELDLRPGDVVEVALVGAGPDQSGTWPIRAIGKIISASGSP